MKLTVCRAVVVIAVLCCHMPAGAQTFLRYLQFPAGTPANPTPLTMPMTLTLPCYGNVLVSVNPNPPTNSVNGVTLFHQTAAENKSPQNNPSISWGADTDRFNVLINGSGSSDYTITFSFLNGPADSSRLYLVVAGLAHYTLASPNLCTLATCTTATVSTTPPTAPGTLVGELQITTTGLTSTTVQTGSTLSSQGDGDPANTGWAIYRPQTGASLSDLSVLMHQAHDDGVGWTLSYQCASVTAADAPMLSPNALSLLIVLLGAAAFIVLGRSVRW